PVGDGLELGDRLRAAAGRRSDAASSRPHARPFGAGLPAEGVAAGGPGAHCPLVRAQARGLREPTRGGRTMSNDLGELAARVARLEDLEAVRAAWLDYCNRLDLGD